jgi:rhamnose transport system ATP-binding protein
MDQQSRNPKMILQLKNIAKSFDGVAALKGVSFELLEGEVHALVGENGAGKSTLIQTITGAVIPDGGTVEFDGHRLVDHSPAHAKALGIAAIYQQPALFPELTVTENISLGIEKPKSWRLLDWTSRGTRAVELLERVGSQINPERDVQSLSMPEQQLVEIARAVGANARVLIMDEPTASLAEEDTQNLYRVIDALKKDGVAIIYISHRLEELEVIADRVTVLRDGSVVETRSMSEVSRTELIRLMVGRELSAVFPKRQVEIGKVVLETKGLSCRLNGVENIDLTVRAGEIVGLAGLVGAGRTQLARTIFGLEPADRGEIWLKDRAVVINEPATAIGLGIAYLPEDRRRHGVVLEMPIDANVTLASLAKLQKGLAFDRASERDIAEKYVRRFAIKAPSLFSAVTTLSGGNQQKVALSRWVETRPSLLILDEPTQGIDVGAKAEIHSLMGELAAQGTAIIMISSDLPEILGMSDRVMVMRNGAIAGSFGRAEANQQNIMAVALGHDQMVA